MLRCERLQQTTTCDTISLVYLVVSNLVKPSLLIGYLRRYIADSCPRIPIITLEVKDVYLSHIFDHLSFSF